MWRRCSNRSDFAAKALDQVGHVLVDQLFEFAFHHWRHDLIDRLAKDSRLGLKREVLDAILAKGDQESGAAKSQIVAFANAVKKLEAAHPAASAYGPGAIL